MFGRFAVLFYLGDVHRAVVRESVDDRIDATHDAQNRFERFVGNGERVGVVVGECRGDVDPDVVPARQVAADFAQRLPFEREFSRGSPLPESRATEPSTSDTATVRSSCEVFTLNFVP